MKLTVLGAGAWGSALAATFCDRHTVTLWAREPEVLRSLRDRRENPRYLPGCRLPEALRIGDDFATAVADADLLVIATPLAGLRPTLCRLRDAAVASPLIWACKGLEAETGKLPHQIVAEELGAQRLCAALSGPSFADEVARGLPTAVTLAASDAAFGQQTALALHSPRFRIYANDDLPGVEVGGAVKNIMAIATGVCDGLGLGLNARAALITRGLAEIARFGVALGGQAQTFMGLAGIGDLILTCTGDLSRNRRVGLELAAGKTLSQILRDLGHVAEGVSTTREVARLASQLAIEMPITQAVDAILYRAEPAASAVEKLLSRDPKNEGR
ncbi:MAG: Glycerol-3-phosphate dehydrogenase [NAD(P)+] [Candidatus Accumulibacter regalis]|jgi:glycerol-3-phosphate dehydrogenase (NAD(P)+)|uniref:Glycerol-3-phosphate dehydrogenase [NAD(P)+] n=1 Tax=Accumulibacter regalis TaxID=522306 RepID=A0A011RC73_ACCRE|nr:MULTISPECIES: NAD(P)H-dependent glycerol-3-phosphate dehydrogenase [unclassified Candidatus Accumulibacter]EXI88824.1 MAG: Glycerol-3-phosphate dehydrogenase [NAD(P)+] [Candidatus Accumulibacter regalis]MQM34055.1 glycerol-3-phosphate dehydrogenase [Candidatus Accumulibacter phosphatis]MBL8366755.1 NAD(P)-dependent glycerol-3-phosphate dehydrogenase [Accumulibacter sp.]MBN8512757.1 NAD(P)-dependent glycerol-3-phosphate dehydrogenase [Accumulibacter sp.]MBO3701481.1 NAD(P)-dependent glycerol